MADNKENIVFFGHSFVRRFGVFLHSNDIHSNLGLNAGRFKFDCIGFGGLHMDRSKTQDT